MTLIYIVIYIVNKTLKCGPTYTASCLRKVVWLEATNIIIPAQVFKFTGQTKVDTYLIDLDLLLAEQQMYDEVMINKVRLAFEAIRFYADNFPYWQRHQLTGRPPTEERSLLAAFLVRQLFDLTFRETEGLLRMLAEYFSLDKVPDHTVLCPQECQLTLVGTLEEVPRLRRELASET